LVSGLSVDKDKIPINEADSAFGMWLYKDGMLFTSINSKIVLDDIAKLYSKCYELYLKIYALMFVDQGGGLLQGLFSSKRASNNEKILAQKYYEELVGVSDELAKRMRLFES